MVVFDSGAGKVPERSSDEPFRSDITFHILLGGEGVIVDDTRQREVHGHDHCR